MLDKQPLLPEDAPRTATASGADGHEPKAVKAEDPAAAAGLHAGGDVKMEDGARGASEAAAGGAVKGEMESSDDELYGAPAAKLPATATMDVSGEDSDDELYGGASGAAVVAAAASDGGVAGVAAPVIGVGGGGLDEDEMDDDDAAIYAVARKNDGDVLVEKSELMVYALKQRDRLLGLGPVGDFALCPHRPKMHEVRKDSMDIVMASGGLAQGKVCVMHRSLIPVVTTAVSLPNAHAVWSVYGHEGDGDEVHEAAAGCDMDGRDGAGAEGAGSGGQQERMHAYLIISEGGDEPGTVVLKGNELEEFDEDEPMDFHTDGATVCVGNLFQNRRIVQVTPWNVLLLKGAVKDQEVPFVAGAGGQIVAAWVHDPYVALLLQDGRMSLLAGDQSTMQLNYVNLGGSTEITGVTAACLFSNPLLRCKQAEGAAGSGTGMGAGAAGREAPDVAGQGAAARDMEAAEEIEVLLAVAPRSGCIDVYALPSLQRVCLGPPALARELYATLDLVLPPPARRQSACGACG